MRFTRLVLLAAVALPVAAQTADPCKGELRAAFYTEYYYNKSKKDANGAPDAAAQKYAYEVGKEYLAKFAATCPDQYTASVKNFVKAYEEAIERYNLRRYAFGAAADYGKAFESGRRLLGNNPNDLPTLMTLAHAGDAALARKNEEFVKEALLDARKAVDQIEAAGTAPASWEPYKSRDEALSNLYFHLGNLAIANQDPASAVPWLIKAAAVEGTAKNDPMTYGRLALAYQTSQLDAMQRDYNAKFGGKPETAESRFTLDQINQVIDRIVDSYARAVSLSGDNPRYAQAKPIWLQSLQTFYKFRVNDAMNGFDEYVANATTRPLPAPFEPKPYVPEPVAAKRKR